MQPSASSSIKGSAERIAIKGDRLFVGVGRAFDRDVGAAGELRAVNVRNHVSDLARSR